MGLGKPLRAAAITAAMIAPAASSFIVAAPAHANSGTIQVEFLDAKNKVMEKKSAQVEKGNDYIRVKPSEEDVAIDTVKVRATNKTDKKISGYCDRGDSSGAQITIAVGATAIVKCPTESGKSGKSSKGAEDVSAGFHW
ncbi:hypothetical protein [Nocardia brasiliensis]|uniref:hypothetical protein n=1 Tax=Nocardia brasiliensis TaxID=37326 RepID=UPI00366AB1F1